ncbi:MAG: hypothetical protein ACRCRZ_01390 [Metamycoplasmataceae bacterium]
MKKWTCKKMAFVAVLIATSIAFVVIGAQMAAISSLPSIKLSLAGLPVKISGYLFGPLVGFIIGFTTDILTFLFVPTFYHPLYSLALAVSGIVPGIFAFFYFRFFNLKFKKEEKIKKLILKKIKINHFLVINFRDDLNSKKAIKFQNQIDKIENKIWNINNSKKETGILNFNLYSALILTIILFIVSFVLFLYIPESLLLEAFPSNSFLHFLSNKIYFLIILFIGFLFILVFIIVTRFKLSEEKYIKIIPILMFVIFTEFINLPIVALADQESLKIVFMISLIGSFAASPIKIWMNLLIITFATKIVTPLIINKELNSY